ncbi:MAG: transglycosylase SLT domain-containing protein [Candidatus Acidiferrales bacterium]
MSSRIAIIVAILLTTLGLSATLAHAQIAFYTDSDGQRIYINGNAPSSPKHSTAASRARAEAPPAVARSTSSDQPPAEASPVASDDSQSASSESASVYAPASAAPATYVPPAAHPSLDQMVHEVAARYNVDPQLIRAVIGQESNWDPHAVSRTGAQGLMQLVPTTARELGVRNAFDPQQNLDGGVRYLRSLLVRYGGDLDKALAAYNAGPGAVDRAGGVPHIAETQHYVQRITDNYYRPGSNRSSHGPMEASHPIYRSTDDSGRVVFTNE